MRPAEISFAALLQDFFVRRLVNERGASARTIESYRDAFELLLDFAERRKGKPPSSLSLADLDAPFVLDFLDHLEVDRGNSARSRNARLAAIRSFMRYAAVRDPTSLPIVQRVLAIATKRFDQPVLEFLSREEMQAILQAPDGNTWSGHRDAVLLATLYNTGARVSEITGLRVEHIVMSRETAVHLHGKGRKERVLPLWKSTATALRRWLDRAAMDANAAVFPSRTGAALSRSGVRERLARAVESATQRCPSLRGKRISPHTIRRSTAMHLLQSGVDISVIALWLGHADLATTHLYLEADIAMKEAALRRVEDPSPKTARFRAGDSLLAFLEGL